MPAQRMSLPAHCLMHAGVVVGIADLCSGATACTAQEEHISHRWLAWISSAGSRLQFMLPRAGIEASCSWRADVQPRYFSRLAPRLQTLLRSHQGTLTLTQPIPRRPQTTSCLSCSPAP